MPFYYFSHSSVEQPSSVNKEAKKRRHQKHFNRKYIAWKSIFKILRSIPHYIGDVFIGILKGKKLSTISLLKAHQLAPDALPVTRLRRRTIISCALLFVFSMVTIPQSNDTGYALSYDDGSYDDYLEFHEFAIDEEGFFYKALPQSTDYDRSELKDRVVHTVESGENLSLIAQKYGLKKVSTLIWENKLSSTSTLKIGQKLIIPPTDGITHKVGSSETISSIAKKYKVDVEKIMKQNGFESAKSALKKGQLVFIPGGKRLYTPPKYIPQNNIVTKSPSGNVSHKPKAGKPFIFPTSGSLTQGYHYGHYAHDIANRSRPYIWAAASGKVVKVYTKGWGGGYGTHIIVDHGNGLKSLYAHLSQVYVKNGQQVDQGQVIGKMGRTGRVYGPTGIHLHFEVIKNGRKMNPWNYY